ncbi:velvet factor-domain-containing protein [Lipomyces tetrasporus]|uniref:Velvet factor-domain-containing protein n=1 Tax=Lipomyces tetrasporus TaxID=54092 RepID=A0AAD7VVZ1_9ASCO|nr:velvet factor-domain-containing protein [Lipomyces tetrasporus]KAJ8102775.1 velvet factor-domain-containing protein [Lipomyces tetrasporus]
MSSTLSPTFNFPIYPGQQQQQQQQQPAAAPSSQSQITSHLPQQQQQSPPNMVTQLLGQQHALTAQYGHLPPPPPPPPPLHHISVPQLYAGQLTPRSSPGLGVDDPSEPYIYQLRVVQQPIRARMCGFGDKDRRPLTPPPCIQLIIKDKVTGQDADISKLDVSFYALTVELWSGDETQNLSLVSTLPLSAGSATQSVHSQVMQQSYYGQMPQHHAHQTPTFVAPPIKNLIGSVVATAFKLHDTQGKLGVWFILQDLSVRTEGEFKLKASFVNLGSPLSPPPASSSSSAPSMHGNGPHSHAGDSATGQQQLPVMVVNTGTARVQATCFSAPFRVYIAKRFPGVIESTELSRCFAMQGIKIPIRKDQKKNAEEQPQQPQ